MQPHFAIIMHLKQNKLISNHQNQKKIPSFRPTNKYVKFWNNEKARERARDENYCGIHNEKRNKTKQDEKINNEIKWNWTSEEELERK